MKTKINCTGLWWIPGQEKLLGTLTFDEMKGGFLSVMGRFLDMSEIEKERYNYPIIVGESDDHQYFTLRNCTLRSSYPYIDSLTKSELNVDTILIGHQFQKLDSINFEKFFVVFSNTDRILSPVAKHVSFNKREKILEVTIKEFCIIRIFAKTTVVKQNFVPRTSLKVDTDIEIVSFKGKTFEKYQEIYNKIADFFNFFICENVNFESIKGICKLKNESGELLDLKEVTILYRYPQISEPNKPTNNINFYIEMKYCLWIPQLLSKWFQVQLSNKLEAVFNLYFAIMFGGPDLFLEFQFLALAQALEVYHYLTIGNDSKFRLDRIPDAEKIRNVIAEQLPEKSKWVDDMISNSINPSLRERLMDLFDHYQLFCYAYLRFNKKEELAQKIKDNRVYFTHWASNLKKKSAKDDDLLWLMKDTQFILRLCLLSEIGIDESGLRMIFCLEEMVERRKLMEKNENNSGK